MKHLDMPTVDDRTFTVKEFCFAESMSLATYYRLQKLGRGPREMRIPGSTTVRISAKARRDWHAQMEAWAEEEQARIAEQRRARSEQTSKAGKIAAASPHHHCRREADQSLRNEEKA